MGSTSPARRGPLRSAPRGPNLTEPWFIGFAPANNPRYAVAVTIDRTQGEFGGPTAGPIFKAVMQTLLQEHP